CGGSGAPRGAKGAHPLGVFLSILRVAASSSPWVLSSGQRAGAMARRRAWRGAALTAGLHTGKRDCGGASWGPATLVELILRPPPKRGREPSYCARLTCNKLNLRDGVLRALPLDAIDGQTWQPEAEDTPTVL